MPGEYVDVKKFNKVVLLYNRNSGKQLFASMMAKVNETYKLVKELVGPKNAEMRDIRFFDQIPQIAAEIVEEKVDWVIIAGGDGTIRAMIEQLANRKYVPYISVFPAGTVNLVAKELLLKADELVRANKMEQAREVQYAINTIIYALCGCKGNMYGVIKEVLRRREGLDIGGVRAPLANLVPEDMPKIEAVCKLIDETTAAYCG